MNNKGLDYTALIITIVGAVIWGMIGLFNWNVVSVLFGSGSWIGRIIYVIVGISGLYTLSFFGRISEKSEI